MKIHFISIGGSVMHQLAIALKRKGYKVSGSDDEIFEPARTNLEKEGLLPSTVGWEPEQINSSIDAIILGMHAKEDNPELAKARALGLSVYSFPEYIYQESILKTRVVVGGSHGKTTTTSIIMHVLKYAGKEFDYLVGARLDGFDQSVQVTNAPLIVCEGDEYPASVLEKSPKLHFLYPHIAVITGIGWDHINVFPNFENYLQQFRIFIEKVEVGGHLVYNETDEVLLKLVQENHRDEINYHPYRLPKHSINNGITSLIIDEHQTELKIFGNHNLLNIHAAWLVCKQLDVSAEQFTRAIQTFSGASKRLELLSKNEEALVYRDFAHAPSKVKATIKALKKQYPDKNLIAVLELHTYSSLNKDFLHEYKGALDLADVAAVFYSTHAIALKRLVSLETEIVKRSFAREILQVFERREDLEQWICNQDFHNSVTVFMSSGDYDGLNIVDLAKNITQMSV